MEKSRDINYWHSTEDLSAHLKIQVRLVVTLYQSKGDQEFQGQGMNFFLTICRLRPGFKEEYLEHLYGVIQTSVSRMTIS